MGSDSQGFRGVTSVDDLLAEWLCTSLYSLFFSIIISLFLMLQFC